MVRGSGRCVICGGDAWYAACNGLRPVDPAGGMYPRRRPTGYRRHRRRYDVAVLGVTDLDTLGYRADRSRSGDDGVLEFAAGVRRSLEDCELPIGGYRQVFRGSSEAATD